MAMNGFRNVNVSMAWAQIVPNMAPDTQRVLKPIRSIRKPDKGDANAEIR